MKSNPLNARLQLLRRDLGNLLFHFARKPGKEGIVEGEGDEFPTWMHNRASAVLDKILKEGKLRGSAYKIRGGHKCVCFTESPITELNATFSMVSIANDPSQHTRYEPYGIAVKKDWLLSKGGRPVIYQPDKEYDLLPEELRYRHVRYDPADGIDFTWEREWRIKTDELILEPEKTLVIVPTANEAFDIMYENSTPELNSVDDEGNPDDVYQKVKWLALSLDFFGFSERLTDFPERI